MFHVSLQVELPLKYRVASSGTGEVVAGAAPLHCPLMQRAVVSGRSVRSHPAVFARSSAARSSLGEGHEGPAALVVCSRDRVKTTSQSTSATHLMAVM